MHAENGAKAGNGGLVAKMNGGLSLGYGSPHKPNGANLGASIRHKDRVLEAIDQLRKRKARPDEARIFLYMAKKHSVDPAEGREALKKCVESGVVLKVEYKGSFSYRNAAKKYSHLKNAVNGQRSSLITYAKPNKKFTGVLDSAMSQLFLEEPDYLLIGVPGPELVKNIMARRSDGNWSEKYVSILIEKQVEHGALTRTDTGNYQLPPRSSSTLRPVSVTTTVSIATTATTTSAPQIIAACNNTSDDQSARSSASSASSSSSPPPSSFETWEKRAAKMYNNNISSIVKTAPPPAPKREIPVILPDDDDGDESNERPPQLSEESALPDTSNNKVDSSDNRNISGATSENGLLRLGSRRKRARKVFFDPSDHHVPKKRGRPTKAATLERERAAAAAAAAASKTVTTSSDCESRPDTPKNLASRGEQLGGVCSVCHNDKKSGGSAAEMIGCRDCSNKAHLGCLKREDDMVLKMYSDSAWQCALCRTCAVCFQTSVAGNLIVCSVCADAYHSTCYSSQTGVRLQDSIKQDPKWTCNNCEMPDPDQLRLTSVIRHEPTTEAKQETKEESFSPEPSDDNLTNPSSPTSHASTPPRLSPQTVIRENESHQMLLNHRDSSPTDFKHHIYDPSQEAFPVNMRPIEEFVDPAIPDAMQWTSVDVYDYFRQHFNEDVAKTFRDNQIDGGSLLLMENNDIISNLNLSLGISLKVLKHVIKLQYRNDHNALYWS